MKLSNNYFVSRPCIFKDCAYFHLNLALFLIPEVSIDKYYGHVNGY